jgi:hypothetical protein
VAEGVEAQLQELEQGQQMARVPMALLAVVEEAALVARLLPMEYRVQQRLVALVVAGLLVQVEVPAAQQVYRLPMARWELAVVVAVVLRS